MTGLCASKEARRPCVFDRESNRRQGDDNHETDRNPQHPRADRRRTDRKRRTFLRHLFPAAPRPHHPARRPHRRRHREPGRGGTPLPEERGSEEGHLPVHQLPGRRGDRRSRHLRHDPVAPVRRLHVLHGPGRVDGRRPARRRHAGQALRSSVRAQKARRRTSRSTRRRFCARRPR